MLFTITLLFRCFRWFPSSSLGTSGTRNHALLALTLTTLLLTACTSTPPLPKAEASPELARLATPVATGEMLQNNTLQLPLSPGDRVRILVDDGAPFSGIFQVDVDGKLHLPYLPPLSATGLSLEQVQQNLTDALVREKLFKPGFARASVQIMQWAPIQVTVAGAVFQPGRVLLNDQQQSPQKYNTAMQLAQESGDYPVQRFLSYALKGAAGVRPDGALRNVHLLRGEKAIDVDLSGIFSGAAVHDVPLIAGDRVVVDSVGHMQAEYIRPSQITPPGFDVFLSNLTQPVFSNSNAAVAKDARSIPYGSRLLQGLLAANCVGGVEATNASRYAVLSSTNRFSGQVEVRRYAVDAIVAQADDQTANPYLMPGDGIACFDSDMVNAKETMKTIAEFLGPIAMMMLLL